MNFLRMTLALVMYCRFARSARTQPLLSAEKANVAVVYAKLNADWAADLLTGGHRNEPDRRHPSDV